MKFPNFAEIELKINNDQIQKEEWEKELQKETGNNPDDFNTQTMEKIY